MKIKWEKPTGEDIFFSVCIIIIVLSFIVLLVFLGILIFQSPLIGLIFLGLILLAVLVAGFMRANDFP